MTITFDIDEVKALVKSAVLELLPELPEGEAWQVEMRMPLYGSEATAECTKVPVVEVVPPPAASNDEEEVAL